MKNINPPGFFDDHFLLEKCISLEIPAKEIPLFRIKLPPQFLETSLSLLLVRLHRDAGVS